MTTTDHSTDLEALRQVRSELATINARMRAIAFETPTPYLEFDALRERSKALQRTQSSLIIAIGGVWSIYGLDDQLRAEI